MYNNQKNKNNNDSSINNTHNIISSSTASSLKFLNQIEYNNLLNNIHESMIVYNQMNIDDISIINSDQSLQDSIVMIDKINNQSNNKEEFFQYIDNAIRKLKNLSNIVNWYKAKKQSLSQFYNNIRLKCLKDSSYLTKFNQNIRDGILCMEKLLNYDDNDINENHNNEILLVKRTIYSLKNIIKEHKNKVSSIIVNNKPSIDINIIEQGISIKATQSSLSSLSSSSSSSSSSSYIPSEVATKTLKSTNIIEQKRDHQYLYMPPLTSSSSTTTKVADSGLKQNLLLQSSSTVAKASTTSTSVDQKKKKPIVDIIILHTNHPHYLYNLLLDLINIIHNYILTKNNDNIKELRKYMIHLKVWWNIERKSLKNKYIFYHIKMIMLLLSSYIEINDVNDDNNISINNSMLLPLDFTSSISIIDNNNILFKNTDIYSILCDMKRMEWRRLNKTTQYNNNNSNNNSSSSSSSSYASPYSVSHNKSNNNNDNNDIDQFESLNRKRKFMIEIDNQVCSTSNNKNYNSKNNNISNDDNNNYRNNNNNIDKNVHTSKKNVNNDNISKTLQDNIYDDKSRLNLELNKLNKYHCIIEDEYLTVKRINSVYGGNNIDHYEECWNKKKGNRSSIIELLSNIIDPLCYGGSTSIIM
jgi:hypothetical protein